MQYSRSEAKEWARQAYQGLDTTILPCFTRDTLELDEAGIRHDMRMLLPQGFFAVTLVSGGEAGTSREEDQRFVEWCVDDARGKVGVTLTCAITRPGQHRDGRYAEAVGCHSVMISYRLTSVRARKRSTSHQGHLRRDTPRRHPVSVGQNVSRRLSCLGANLARLEPRQRDRYEIRRPQWTGSTSVSACSASGY
jgi:hypothetical protein